MDRRASPTDGGWTVGLTPTDGRWTDRWADADLWRMGLALVFMFIFVVV